VNARDAVLVESGQGLDVGVGTDLDFVLEQLKRCLRSSRFRLSCILLHLDQVAERPLASRVGEDEGKTVVSASDGGVLVREHDRRQRQKRQSDGLNVTGSSTGNIDESGSRIVSDEGEAVAGGRPADVVDPASDLVLRQHVTEPDLVSERCRWWRFVIDGFDPGGEDTSLEVAGTCQQQHVVRMPINRQHSRLMLFDLSADPPVVVLVEEAHRYTLR